MKKRSLVFAWIMAAVFCCAACLTASQNPPADVLKAAEEGLQPYLNKIPVNELEQYGFAQGDTLLAATLGAPFQLHTITPAALEKFSAGTPVGTILTPTSLWYFPVVLAGQTRAVLVVDQLDGKWQAVSLGYAPLAKELGAIRAQWKAAQGYNPVLAVVFQARQYLFTVPEKDANNLTPITSARQPAAKDSGSDYAVLAQAADVIAKLKPAVQSALKESK